MTSRTKVIGTQVGILIERELDASPEVEGAIVSNFGRPVDEVVYPTEMSGANLQSFYKETEITDAVHAALKLLYSCDRGETVTHCIADVADAFWLVPLHQLERKYFVAKLKGKCYYIFLRTAQGSRGAPLTFAVLMALATRFVQSTLCFCKRQDCSPEGMMQVHVDDPLTVLKGSEHRHRRLACMVSVAWMLLGIPMAFHKAVLASAAVWIGVSLEVTGREVRVEVTEAKVTELLQLISEALAGKVIPCKKLHTLVGKCMAVASVLYVWRPFLQVLFAALHGPNKAPWHQKIVYGPSRLDIRSCGFKHVFEASQGASEEYYDSCNRVQITWDASPYGMGAFLTVDGRVREHIAIPISANDEELLGAKAGTSERSSFGRAYLDS
eukprot:s3998_g4.t1